MGNAGVVAVETGLPLFSVPRGGEGALRGRVGAEASGAVSAPSGLCQPWKGCARGDGGCVLCSGARLLRPLKERVGMRPHREPKALGLHLLGVSQGKGLSQPVLQRGKLSWGICAFVPFSPQSCGAKSG